jgi:hypothetical protein
MRTPTTYDIVHLADDEWDSETMQRVAKEWFERHPDCNFVQVYEHAGWFLTFSRNGRCVGSANGGAVFPAGTVFPTEFSGFSERRQTDVDYAREGVMWDALKRGDVAKLAALLQ